MEKQLPIISWDSWKSQPTTRSRIYINQNNWSGRKWYAKSKRYGSRVACVQPIHNRNRHNFQEFSSQIPNCLSSLSKLFFKFWMHVLLVEHLSECNMCFFIILFADLPRVYVLDAESIKFLRIAFICNSRNCVKIIMFHHVIHINTSSITIKYSYNFFPSSIPWDAPIACLEGARLELFCMSFFYKIIPQDNSRLAIRLFLKVLMVWILNDFHICMRRKKGRARFSGPS